MFECYIWNQYSEIEIVDFENLSKCRVFQGWGFSFIIIVIIVAIIIII